MTIARLLEHKNVKGTVWTVFPRDAAVPIRRFTRHGDALRYAEKHDLEIKERGSE